MNIYENILAEANKQGKTISQVEKDSGLKNGAISKWKSSSPTVKNLEAVAVALGVDIKALMQKKQ